MKNNVVLIGMPGAGKSSVGIVLAKVLGYQFIDTDLLIQKDTQKRLWQIIEDDGIPAFLEIEERINRDIDTMHSVIAPGGSIIYSSKAMEHFKDIATIVYLEADYELIKRRIGNFEHRGVICHIGKTLKDLYDERTPLYEQYADITIHQTDDSISKSVADIIDGLISCGHPVNNLL